ncbi:MAG: ATP-binding protein, partial [Maribacter sp.]
FEVKGANNDGVWQDTASTLKIKVKPAPWKSAWAYLVYSLLTLSGLYTLYTIIKSKAKLKQDLRWEQLENERKEEIHQAKLEFFTNISHDLRTPLTLILGPLQQLLGEYKGSSLMYKKLLTIESSAKHLLQLINRLMDFRKLENRQSKLQAAKGNMVKFLKEIYLSFTELAKVKGYTYTFESSQDSIAVFYDRSKLEQVFYNLISNAFKYTPSGGNITIKIWQEANKVYVSVEDSGIGIKKKHIDKVFDRFFEIPNVNNIKNRNNNGTGIGLSIAKSIVELHSGTVSVSSQGHKGSKFEVILPLGKKHLKETEIIDGFKFSDDIDQYTSEVTEKEEFLDDLQRDKDLQVVLIVEDNKELRSFIKTLLRKEYSILEAENGKQGLKKALKYIPDLIISDVMMPKMAGTELCAQIKLNLRTSHIPVILLTARTSLIYKFKGLESGADDYISKPFNVKEFKLRVRNLLDSAQRLKEKFSSETILSAEELTATPLDEKLLKKAIKVVEQNISNENFDVSNFSQDLGVSRTILFSKIKAWTNFTPNGFVNEMRLK